MKHREVVPEVSSTISFKYQPPLMWKHGRECHTSYANVWYWLALTNPLFTQSSPLQQSLLFIILDQTQSRVLSNCTAPFWCHSDHQLVRIVLDAYRTRRLETFTLQKPSIRICWKVLLVMQESSPRSLWNPACYLKSSAKSS